MAVYLTFKCTKCRHEVETSGPHEFYRDREGKRKRYGHPLPVSLEAQKMGISGLSIISYCPKCDRRYDSILVEYKKPSNNKITIWAWLLQLIGKYDNKPRCPECKEVLIFDVEEFKNVKCPRCKKGKFVLEETIQT